MARQRVVLQPPKTLSGTEIQKNKDAARVGNNRSGVVFCDVYSIGGTFTVTISSCSDLESTTGALASWVPLGSLVFTQTESKKLPVTDLGDALRWEGMDSTGSTTFALTVFLSNQ